jgi:hypothetical protein
MRTSIALPALIASALLACAHRPAVVTDELPLRRVVVYRNGVGYFERGGTVHSDRIRFRVRPDHVGDFLASLAVMEHGGSSVRAAAFPLELEDEEAPAPNPEPAGNPAHSKNRLETVVLELDGSEHEIAVGYIAEQPVWKPSYRLVFSDGGPVLQAWGIVQNLSGEDWNGISLSLVAGAPIAFQSTLHTAVTPQRPVVTDSGEMIASVPQGQTTLAQRPPPQPSSPALTGGAPVSASKAKRSRPAGDMERHEVNPEATEQALDAITLPRAAMAPAPEPPPGISMPRNLALLASAQPTAGATRYDLPSPVTVPDDSATMVLYLAQKVPGEAVFMFAPDGGVPDSASHPFRVARFSNATRGLLERGPIAFFEASSFLGQGVLEPLGPDATATVPFALERGIGIESERKGEQRGARLARIEAGRLTIERDQVLKTYYRLRSGIDRQAKVLVKHPRAPGMRLFDPPSGTEDNLGTGNALVPISVAAHSTAELKVEEVHSFQIATDWLAPEADEAVKSYLDDRRADPKLCEGLRQAWAIRLTLLKAAEEQSRRTAEREILENGAEQTRESLKTIEHNRGNVSDLLKKLSERLIELDRKIADANKRLVELELQMSEQRVRFEEMVREIRLTETLPAA